MTVCTVKCPKCGDEIYSRCTHDMNFCSCGSVAIDGGRLYMKITVKQDVKHADLEYGTAEITATTGELYDDWNKNIDKLGRIRANKTTDKR